MKKFTSLILLLVLFSCSSPSSKIIGKWYIIGTDKEVYYKMDGKTDANMIGFMEFNKDGNAFLNLIVNITPYKWELSNNKIILTSQQSAETIEIFENRILILTNINMPFIFVKEDDKMSNEELTTIVNSTLDKCQFFKQLKNLNK